MLKHILGLLKPTYGSVFVLGNLNNLSEFELKKFRRHFGMLFQYAALFDSLSAYENVAFPLNEFTNLSEEEVEEKVYGLLESVELRLILFLSYLLSSLEV